MTNLVTFNAARETRTEARVEQILLFLKTPKYKEQILDEFSVKWGVSGDTVAHALHTATRTKRVVFERGLYKVVA